MHKNAKVKKKKNAKVGVRDMKSYCRGPMTTLGHSEERFLLGIKTTENG